MDPFGEKDLLKSFFLEAYPRVWVNSKDADVIMVLASGKCGTTTMTHLLNTSPEILAYHELAPRLWHLGHRVFWDRCESRLWDEVYWACRRDMISVVNENGLIYAENNQRASVFGPAVKRLVPDTKFVVLWRDFDETVVSGCRWGWYGHADRTAEGRILPPKDLGLKDIRDVTAWYWIAFYRQILDFVGDNAIFFPFEWIKKHKIEKIQGVFEQLGVVVPHGDLIRAVLDRKYNSKVNNQEVPKVWGRFDREAAEITEQLMGAAKP